MGKLKKPRRSITKFVELLMIKEHLIENINASENEEEKQIFTVELENVQSQINKIKKIP